MKDTYLNKMDKAQTDIMLETQQPQVEAKTQSGACSIHNHLEDKYDAVNTSYDDIAHKPTYREALNNYLNAGYTTIALTSHGNLGSYDDICEVKPDNLNVIPAIEGYLSPRGEHIILIPKDNIGYEQLIGIINHSEKNISKDRMEIPLEVIKEYCAEKGHMMCTTACVQGILGEEYYHAKKNLKKTQKLIENNEEYTKKIEEDNKQIDTLLEEIMTLDQEKKELKTELMEISKIESSVAKKRQQLNKKGIDENTDSDFLDLKARLDYYLSTDGQNEITKKNNQLLDVTQNIANIRGKKNSLMAEVKKLTGKIKDIPNDMSIPEIEERAIERYRLFKDIFGDDFYVELQNHNIVNPDFENNLLEADVYSFVYRAAIKADANAKFIASNDTHISCERSSKKLNKMVKRRNIMSSERYSSSGNNYYKISDDDYELSIKTIDELKASLLELKNVIPENVLLSAIDNTNVISNFKVDRKFSKHYIEIENAESIFDELIQQGIEKKFGGTLSKEYQERLEYEKQIIKSMGFVSYHLTVEDFLNTTRKMFDGMPVGLGRGSAVGSLVCYLLDITQLDPMKFNLIFERFLNPERVTMPDIDSDFRPDTRQKAIEYCEEHYGYTARIGTKAYVKRDGALRIATRYAAKVEYNERLKENPNEKPDYKIILREWFARADDLAKILKIEDKEFDENEFTDDDDEKEREELSKTFFNIAPEDYAKMTDSQKYLFDIASKVVGTFSTYGQHAAGVLISTEDIKKYLPMQYNAKKESWQTFANKEQVEQQGFLKFDFLGLTTLQVITDIYKLLSEKDKQKQEYRLFEKVIHNTITSEEFDEFFDDKATYEKVYANKNACGVFQCGTQELQQFLKDYQTSCIEDVIAMVSMYRPGPKSSIPEVCYAKTQTPLEQDLGKDINTLDYTTSTIPKGKYQDVDNILASTYGCLVYQEQVMQIVQTMAGYSLGGADIVRRIMSKKKPEALAKEKTRFFNGDQNYKQTIITIEGFAGQTPISLPYTINEYLDNSEAIKEYFITHKQEYNDFCQKNNITKVSVIKIKDPVYTGNTVGCLAKGYDKEYAETVWEKMTAFAKYAFNKSHGAVYGATSFITAYCKAHFPEAFYVASCYSAGDIDKLVELLHDAEYKNNIKVYPPMITDKGIPIRTMVAGDMEIVRGIDTIKGLGESAIINPNEVQDGYIKAYTLEEVIEKKIVGVGTLIKMCNAGVFSKQYPNINTEYLRGIAEAINDEKLTIADIDYNELTNAQRDYAEEYELLNDVYDVDISLLTPIADKGYTGQNEYLNMLVLSVSKPLLTKSGNTYYNVLLCDVEGKKHEFRLKEKPTTQIITVNAPNIETRYFSCEHKPYNGKIAIVSDKVNEAIVRAAMYVTEISANGKPTIRLILDQNGRPIKKKSSVLTKIISYKGKLYPTTESFYNWCKKEGMLFENNIPKSLMNDIDTIPKV